MSLNLFCKWVCTNLIILHLEVNQYIAITTAHIHLFKAALKIYIYIHTHIYMCKEMGIKAKYNIYFLLCLRIFPDLSVVGQRDCPPEKAAGTWI